MRSSEFCYWLQGYFELRGADEPLSDRQLVLVRKHLALVKKVEGTRLRGFPAWLEPVLDVVGADEPCDEKTHKAIVKKLGEAFKHEIDKGPERLSEIEAREKAATPGPWTLRRRPPYNSADFDGRVSSRSGLVCERWPNGNLREWGRNGAFIGHARQDVPDLLEEVRRLQVAVAGFRAALVDLSRFSCQGGETSDWCRHSGIEARLFCGPCRAKLALCGAP